VAAPRTVLQAAAPAADGDGVEQDLFDGRGEDGIAGLDGEVTIAQLVSQADLPRFGMAALGAVEIGDPDLRARTATGTARARLGRMTCSDTASFWNTHSHWFFPPTRALVSSEQTSRARRRRVRMRLAALSNNGAARANRLANAPSLIARPKRWPNSAASRS
jgi:hypothetical protein